MQSVLNTEAAHGAWPQLASLAGKFEIDLRDDCHVISCEVRAESKEMVSFNDNDPARASPDSIDIRKET